jgi:large subunit ribosomal protein L23
MKDPQAVLIRPLLTEKSLLAKERRNVLAFEVAPRANKIEVAQAVERAFGTKVASVRIVNALGKNKRMGRFEGKRPDRKKAYVTLRKDQKPVEYFEGI